MGKLRYLEGSGLELSPVSQLWSQSPSEQSPGLLAGLAPPHASPHPQLHSFSSTLVLGAQALFSLGIYFTTAICSQVRIGSREELGQPKGTKTK